MTAASGRIILSDMKTHTPTAYEKLESGTRVFDFKFADIIKGAPGEPLEMGPTDHLTVAVYPFAGQFVAVGIAVLKPGDEYNLEAGSAVAKYKMLANTLDNQAIKLMGMPATDEVLQAIAQQAADAKIKEIRDRREQEKLDKFLGFSQLMSHDFDARYDVNLDPFGNDQDDYDDILGF